MTKYAKLIESNDNIVTVLDEVAASEEVTVIVQGQKNNYVSNNEIPFGHKLAIKDIKKGEEVVKYGFKIGTASIDIAEGDWVHTHNVKDDYKCLDKDGQPLPGQGDN